jgi:hypothetical protein
MNPIARLILIVVYAILALAATGRSSYELTVKFSEAPVPYSISAVSALIYILVTVALWRRWRTVALVGSAVELLGVLTVGLLTSFEPTWWPDKTVWTGFGSGYGWVPVLLPMVALYFLIRGRRAVGATSGNSAE